MRPICHQCGTRVKGDYFWQSEWKDDRVCVTCADQWNTHDLAYMTVKNKRNMMVVLVPGLQGWWKRVKVRNHRDAGSEGDVIDVEFRVLDDLTCDAPLALKG